MTTKLPCSACKLIVQVQNLGKHLSTFCMATKESREDMMGKWNKYFPLTKSFERGEITAEELDTKFKEIFG